MHFIVIDSIGDGIGLNRLRCEFDNIALPMINIYIVPFSPLFARFTLGNDYYFPTSAINRLPCDDIGTQQPTFILM